MAAFEDIFTHFMADSKQAQRNGKITILVLLVYNQVVVAATCLCTDWHWPFERAACQSLNNRKMQVMVSLTKYLVVLQEEGFGWRTPSVLGSGGNALVLLNTNFFFSLRLQPARPFLQCTSSFTQPYKQIQKSFRRLCHFKVIISLWSYYAYVQCFMYPTVNHLSALLAHRHLWLGISQSSRASQTFSTTITFSEYTVHTQSQHQKYVLSKVPKIIRKQWGHFFEKCSFEHFAQTPLHWQLLREKAQFFSVSINLHWLL